jgi:hypothetical protein
MKVLLIDVDSKIPNIALMKLSAYHKANGDTVFLNKCDKPDKVYASAIFTKSKYRCELLQNIYPGIEIGGTSWDIKKKLPSEVEKMNCDYSLYNFTEGMGFTTRGCIRNCEFCFVPKKEGKLCQDQKISDIINGPNLTLLDNNFTADPLMTDKCQEIKERNLTINICQGLDIRLMTDEKAKAITSIRHKDRIKFAWDLMKYEKQVMQGIEVMTQYCSGSRLKCYILCGFNTAFEEDMYRFEKLRKLKILPYVMVFNDKKDIRLKHFERWVNGFVFYKCSWDEYKPWVKERDKKYKQLSLLEV